MSMGAFKFDENEIIFDFEIIFSKEKLYSGCRNTIGVLIILSNILKKTIKSNLSLIKPFVSVCAYFNYQKNYTYNFNHF